ncbi:MAG TPA: UDP-N-acetylmuramoyl-L-alanine--D-glutamate ligase, partial [Polyangiales bacterium]
MQLQGKRVAVVGLGESGAAATRLLLRQGAQVTVNDARSREQLGDRAHQLEALGARLDLGGHDADRLSQHALIVVSPGVPSLPALDEAERRGVLVVSEIELASWFVQGTVIGITGTNGKSTVTTLLGEMCKRTGRPTFVGGNLGTPLVDVVGSEAAGPDGFVVVELSSFQLERVERFRAHVGVLLNVTDDHLDRYPSFAAYAAAKGRLFGTQSKGDFAVAPSGDELCLSLARVSPGTLARFAGKDGSVRRQGDQLIDEESGLRLPVAELGIKGDHNVDNACAAALAARLAGIGRQDVEAVLRSFQGLGHRMQSAGPIGQVEFFDDSKATNVGAAVAAVLGLGRQGVRVVLIAGGKDKGGSYQPLVEVMQKHGRALVLIGEATSLIEQAFEGVRGAEAVAPKSSLAIARAGSMRDAVRLAHRLAAPSDAVLLAPACASFDMFRSYAHRGDVFVAEVAA